MSETNRNRPFVRVIASFGMLLLAVFIVAWISSAVPAQDRSKPGKREEEEEPVSKAAKQPGKKAPKEEEEEPVKGKRKPLIRVGDEDEQAADKQQDAATSDLEREAQKTKNPAVRNLFQSLKKPHDVVTTKDGLTLVVEPIAKYITPETQFKGLLKLHLFTDDWRRGRDYPVGRLGLLTVDPYEHIALTKVNDFLASGLEREPATSAKHLSRTEMLQEAEKVLAAVIRFHESARLRGLREPDGWDEAMKPLHAALQSIQLDQLGVLTDSKDWNAAFDLATRLMEKYRKESAVQLRVAQLLKASADQAVQGGQFDQARNRLLLLEKDFPDSQEVSEVRLALRTQAQAVAARADEILEKTGNTEEAIRVLKTAEGIYQLPGLHDRILKLTNKYPVLYVGVHELPQNLAPGLAFSASDKQAVELIYESLIKLTYSPASGQRYETELVGEMPRLVPLGRRFQILHNAFWSDGKLVTAIDVQNTVRLLSDPKWPGYIPEWAEFMDNGKGARVSLDAFHIDLTMRQGYLDPLSFMDFKILPQSLSRASEIGKFAKAPTGSGPFKFDKDKTKAGEDIVFVANPYYAEREGKIGLPRIREIHFVVSKEPAADFEQGRLHLLLDVPAKRLKQMATLPNVTTMPPIRNRRIYFLAVNHRRNVLGNPSLRRAIAHAIDREKILSDVFRDGHADWHRPLNGPYPRNSWACNQNIPADPFNPATAKAAADSARQERPVLPTLTLLYPDDDPAVKQACEMIQKQVQEVGITLNPSSRSRAKLHREVEEDNNYDLAYYYWDFPNEAYWIWPLLDPAAAVPGGRNFLGYVNDDQLSRFFRKTMTHREFPVVRGYTHDIHDRIYEQMPFIPLWQLDTHLVYHNSLTPPSDIDPLLVFTDVENWELKKR